jgi:hypothetical protein
MLRRWVDGTSRDVGSLSRREPTPNDFNFPGGAISDGRIRQLMTSADVGVTASARRGPLSLRTSIGAQYVRSLNDGLSSFGSDLPPGATSVGEAASIMTGQTYHETVTLGSYVKETIGLNDRLFLAAALRVDGANAFGRNYKASLYPKVIRRAQRPGAARH